MLVTDVGDEKITNILILSPISWICHHHKNQDNVVTNSDCSLLALFWRYRCWWRMLAIRTLLTICWCRILLFSSPTFLYVLWYAPFVTNIAMKAYDFFIFSRTKAELFQILKITDYTDYPFSYKDHSDQMHESIYSMIHYCIRPITARIWNFVFKEF